MKDPTHPNLLPPDSTPNPKPLLKSNRPLDIIQDQAFQILSKDIPNTVFKILEISSKHGYEATKNIQTFRKHNHIAFKICISIKKDIFNDPDDSELTENFTT